MNLPFATDTKTYNRPYYFSLVIGEGVLHTGLWTLENKKVQVLALGTHEKYLTGSDFVKAADKSLTNTASALKLDPTNIKRVILGLPSEWLHMEKILPEKARFLKEVCQKLALKPIGFVVTAEAVVRFLQISEGVPPTAILIGITESDLEVTMVRLGKIVGIHTVKRGNNISEDVKEGLARFLPSDLFPSRILLYDHGAELETVRQNLLSFPWQSPMHRLPFIHFPKIDILPTGISVKAVSTTAGQEAVSIEPTEEIPSTNSDHEASDDVGFVENVDLAITPRAIKTKSDISNIPNKPKANIKLNKLPSWRFSPIIPGLIIVVLLPVIYWYYFVTAEIRLTFNPQTVKTSFSAQIPTENIAAEIATEISLPTTGQVLVGDKATGAVTIINGTQAVKTFNSGTELISDSGLKFITQDNVTVNSATGSADPNSYQPGKAEVKITAVNIGQESNLSAGTDFKIGSFSKLDFVARNNQALSGGSSRQAQAVAKKDIEEAKSLANNDLAAKEDEALKSKLVDNLVLIPGTIVRKTITESTNVKEGEEANLLILTKKIKAESRAYQKDTLNNMVLEKLAPQISSNTKQLSDPKIEISYANNQANINASVDLAQNTDTENIAKKLLGRSTTNLKENFKDLQGLTNVSIEFRPKYGNLFKRIPLRLSNLAIFSTFTTQ